MRWNCWRPMGLWFFCLKQDRYDWFGYPETDQSTGNKIVLNIKSCLFCFGVQGLGDRSSYNSAISSCLPQTAANANRLGQLSSRLQNEVRQSSTLDLINEFGGRNAATGHGCNCWTWETLLGNEKMFFTKSTFESMMMFLFTRWMIWYVMLVPVWRVSESDFLDDILQQRSLIECHLRQEILPDSVTWNCLLSSLESLGIAHGFGGLFFYVWSHEVIFPLNVEVWNQSLLSFTNLLPYFGAFRSALSVETFLPFFGQERWAMATGACCSVASTPTACLFKEIGRSLWQSK